MTKATYDSDVNLGERYRDSQTGFEGVATAIYFFQYGCERVEIQTMDKKTQEIRTNTFDAPRLVSLTTGKAPAVTRSGGPGSFTEGRGRIEGRGNVAGRDRCPSTRLSGAHCTLEAGHAGAHVEVTDNGVTGWANETGDRSRL